nr:TPA_asm: hypothetical protein [Phagomor virus 3]
MNYTSPMNNSLTALERVAEPSTVERRVSETTLGCVSDNSTSFPRLDDLTASLERVSETNVPVTRDCVLTMNVEESELALVTDFDREVRDLASTLHSDSQSTVLFVPVEPEPCGAASLPVACERVTAECLLNEPLTDSDRVPFVNLATFNSVISRMTALDLELEDGPELKPGRYVSNRFCPYYNPTLFLPTVSPGCFFTAQFGELSSETTIYIYRNTLRISHLHPDSTFLASVLHAEMNHSVYDCPAKPDYPSPFITDAHCMDVLDLSKVYARLLAPDRSCQFAHVSQSKNQLPVRVRFDAEPFTDVSERQFTVFNIPEDACIYISRIGTQGLFVSITLPAAYERRVLVQCRDPLANVIKAGDTDIPDKFPISFKRTRVHRHMIQLSEGHHKAFWKFILNQPVTIAMKYACVMSDVIHEYCDFSQPDFVANLFSFLHLTEFQLQNRAMIMKCLYGTVDNTNAELISSLPLVQGLLDFNITTDFSDSLSKLVERADFIGNRLFDVQKLFENSTVTNFKHGLRVFLVSLISNIYILSHQTTTGVRIAACINIINTIPSGSSSLLSASFMKGLMSITSFMDSTRLDGACTSRPLVQSDIVFPAEGILTSVVQVILGFLKSSDDRLVKIEDFRVKRLINLLKLSTFTCKSADFAQTLYTKAMDIVNVYIFGVRNTDEFYSSLHADLPLWLRNCIKYELNVDDADKVSHPLIDLTKYDKKLELIRHVAEGERILKVLVASDIIVKYARVISYVQIKLTNLKKLMSSVGANLVGMNGKHSPFVCFVHGAPGLGKSMMVDFFLHGLFACSEEKYNPNVDKFAKSMTTQYWNGYDSQKVYLIDDFLQSKDETVTNESLADLIALGSRAPFPLNRADVEGKGTSFFNSEVVMITAQSAFSEAYFERFVQSGRAIQRRIDAWVEVVAAPGFADNTGKIDVTKVGQGFNPDACLYNLTINGVRKERLSFVDCVIACATARCTKRGIEQGLDDCKVTDVNWNEKFRASRTAFVQMMSDELFVSAEGSIASDEIEDFSFSCESVWNTAPRYQAASREPLPDTLSISDHTCSTSTSGSYNFLPGYASSSASISSEYLRAAARNPASYCSGSITPPESACSMFENVDDWSSRNREYLNEPAFYCCCSEIEPCLDDDHNTILTEDFNAMYDDLDADCINNAIANNIEPELITVAGRNRWKAIKERVHKFIDNERRILHLAEDRSRVRQLFQSKLVLGFLATNTILLSIFALYKIFNHFRTSKSVPIPINVQKEVNIAVRARKNEQIKAESREFDQTDIDWMFEHVMEIAEERGYKLTEIIKEEEIPAVKKTLLMNLNADLQERLDEPEKKVVFSEDLAPSEPCGCDREDCAQCEVARAIRRAKYSNDDSRTKKGRRILRQAASSTDFESLKIKLSTFDDARNTKLIKQLTNEDFSENKCRCCERYYLYQRDCEQPFECPYTDCDANIDKTPRPDRLLLHGYGRATLLTEILEKSRYGLPICESARDPQLMTILELTRSNLVRVKVANTGHSLCGLIIDSDILCFPLHLFTCNTDYGEMLIEVSSVAISNYRLLLKDTKFIVDEARDIVFVQLIKYPLRRSLVKFFHKNDDRLNFYESGYLAKINENALLTLLSINEIEVLGKLDYFFTNNPTDTRSCVIDSHAKYNGDTQSGDCGAPIFYVNRAFSRKILGFHVAGSTGKGMSNIITQEYLEEKLDQFRRFVKAQVQLEGFTDSSRIVTEGDVVTLLGRVECGLGKPGNTESSIAPSLIMDHMVPHTTKPCMLSRQGDIDPLRIGISKAFKPDIAFESWMLEMATADVSVNVMSMRSDYERMGLLSDDQNVNGDFEKHRIEGLNMHSSAGYPWNLLFLDGKMKYFEGTEHELRMNRILETTVKKRENALKQGIIPPFIMQDTLKDERREIAKVDSGKTRVFSAGPVDMTILVRKYYGSFMAHLMENCVNGECSVGLNVHGDEWSMMYNNLKSVGDHWIAGDYAAYDKRLPYQILMCVADVVNAWYDDSDENKRVREGLMIAMASSLHLADHVVYETHHGMPSGVPITAVGNSVANSIMFRVAFLDIATEKFGKEKAVQLFSDFNALVRMVAYGDDHILRVSKAVSWFNMISISKFYAKYGMEYTTTSKTAAQEEFVEDDDLMYLKRKFVRRDGKYWAPLDRNSINEMINWTRKSRLGPESALAANVDMALIEMSHYPKEEWQQFYNQLMPILRKKRLRIPRLTYHMCLHLVSGYVFDPLYLMNVENQLTSSRALVEDYADQQMLQRKIARYVTKQHIEHPEEKEVILPKALKRITLADAIVVKVAPKKRNQIQTKASDGDTAPRVLAQVGTELTNDIDRANADDPITVAGLTKFSDQSGETEVENNAIMGKLKGLTVYGSQTLTEFIERPYLVSQFTWKSASPAMVHQLEFPTELFNVKSLSEKLTNFRYLRADLEISVRVNASKFHYGKLMAIWKPHCLNGLDDWEKLKTGAWDNLISASGFQHIFISPTSNEVQTIRIPYALPQLYIDLADWAGKTNAANVRYNMGNLQFFVVAPLRCSGKIPNVDISVFARFMNVQMEAYVSEPFSVGSYKPTPVPSQVNVTEITSYAFLCHGFYQKRAPINRVLAQVGNPEASRKASGGLSDMLIGGAALVGSITTAATLVSKLAGVSLDKPFSTESPKNVIMRYSEFALTKGMSNAMLLATDPDNRVGDITNWMGSTTEHMNIATYAGRYGIVYWNNIKVTDVPGTQFCGFPVTPCCVPYFDNVTDHHRYLYNTPLSFMASMFTWWRGSMKYKLQVIASAFHACRIRIAWHPVLTITKDRSELLEYESNVISHVLDITTDTEFEFTIPYLNDDPVLPCHQENMACNGYIIISVINTLTHASDPVPDVDFMLWVAGGDDMEFFRPDNKFLSNTGFGKKLDEERVLAQVGQAISAESTNSPLAPAQINVLNNMLCGERIVNISDVLKRPCGMFAGTATEAGAYGRAITPHVLSNVSSFSYAPFLAYLSGGYRFWRGSFVTNVIKTTNSTYFAFNSLCTLNGVAVESPTLIPFTDAWQHLGQAAIFSPANNMAPCEVAMPYYSNYLFLPTNFQRYNVVVDGIPTVLYSALVSNTSDMFTIAAGDDFTFGGIIGPPTLAVDSGMWK